MKKYITADLRVINIADDIIATSTSGDVNNTPRAAWGTSGRRDMFDDSYDEF